MGENQELKQYCPRCGSYTRPTKLSNYVRRLCKSCNIYLSEEKCILIQQEGESI